MKYPGFQRFFFLIDTDCSRRSRVNEAQSAKEKKILFFSPRRFFFCVNAASVSIRKKYPLEPRVTMKLQRKEIPARSTCHVSRERAVLDLITLHDTAIISKLRKKSISNLHVAGMLDNLNFFLTMQFYRSQACDPRAFLTAICTLRVLSCCLFVCLFCCLLFVVCFS